MPPRFTPDFQPTLLKNIDPIFLGYVYGAFTLYGKTFQSISTSLKKIIKPSLSTPHLPIISHRDSVCPTPLSIDFTNGIA